MSDIERLERLAFVKALDDMDSIKVRLDKLEEWRSGHIDGTHVGLHTRVDEAEDQLKEVRKRLDKLKEPDTPKCFKDRPDLYTSPKHACHDAVYPDFDPMTHVVTLKEEYERGKKDGIKAERKRCAGIVSDLLKETRHMMMEIGGTRHTEHAQNQLRKAAESITMEKD